MIFEILYTILGLMGCYLVMKKNRIGWMFWLVGTPFILTVLILRKAYIMIPAFVVYGFLDWKGWIEWKK